MTDSSPLLKLENVSREFPSAEGDQPLRVLRGLSLEVTRGESVAVVGPSGCGKSTLLNLIGSLDQPTGALDEATADKLGQLLVELNVEENLTLITVTHSPDLAARMARTVKLAEGQIA